MNFAIIKNIYLNFVGRYSINVIVWLFTISLIGINKYSKTQNPEATLPIMIGYAMYFGTALFVIFLVILFLEQKYKFRIRTKWLLYNPLYIIPLLFGLYWTVICIIAGICFFVTIILEPHF